LPRRASGRICTRMTVAMRQRRYKLRSWPVFHNKTWRYFIHSIWKSSRLWRCNEGFSNNFGGCLSPVLGPDII